jgi:hypothetical protein
MELDPAARYSEVKPGLVFGRRSLELEQHRIIDQLDIDAAGHRRLNAGDELDQLARCGFRVGVGTSAVSFMRQFGGGRCGRGRRECGW